MMKGFTKIFIYVTFAFQIFISDRLEAVFYPATSKEEVVRLMRIFEREFKENPSNFARIDTLKDLEYYYYVFGSDERYEFLLRRACGYSLAKLEKIGDKDSLIQIYYESISVCFQLLKQYDKGLEYIELGIKETEKKNERHRREKVSPEEVFPPLIGLEKMIFSQKIEKAKCLYFLGQKKEANELIEELISKRIYETYNGAGRDKKEILFYYRITGQDEKFVELLERVSTEKMIACHSVWWTLPNFNAFLENMLVKDFIKKHENRIQKIRENHENWVKVDPDYGMTKEDMREKGRIPQARGDCR
jgi:hypothetical protein